MRERIASLKAKEEEQKILAEISRLTCLKLECETAEEKERYALWIEHQKQKLTESEGEKDNANRITI